MIDTWTYDDAYLSCRKLDGGPASSNPAAHCHEAAVAAVRAEVERGYGELPDSARRAEGGGDMTDIEMPVFDDGEDLGFTLFRAERTSTPGGWRKLSPHVRDDYCRRADVVRAEVERKMVARCQPLVDASQWALTQFSFRPPPIVIMSIYDALDTFAELKGQADADASSGGTLSDE